MKILVNCELMHAILADLGPEEAPLKPTDLFTNTWPNPGGKLYQLSLEDFLSLDQLITKKLAEQGDCDFHFVSESYVTWRDQLDAQWPEMFLQGVACAKSEFLSQEMVKHLNEHTSLRVRENLCQLFLNRDQRISHSQEALPTFQVWNVLSQYEEFKAEEMVLFMKKIIKQQGVRDLLISLAYKLKRDVRGLETCAAALNQYVRFSPVFKQELKLPINFTEEFLQWYAGLVLKPYHKASFSSEMLCEKPQGEVLERSLIKQVGEGFPSLASLVDDMDWSIASGFFSAVARDFYFQPDRLFVARGYADFLFRLVVRLSSFPEFLIDPRGIVRCTHWIEDVYLGTQMIKHCKPYIQELSRFFDNSLAWGGNIAGVVLSRPDDYEDRFKELLFFVSLTACLPEIFLQQLGFIEELYSLSLEERILRMQCLQEEVSALNVCSVMDELSQESYIEAAAARNPRARESLSEFADLVSIAGNVLDDERRARVACQRLPLLADKWFSFHPQASVPPSFTGGSKKLETVSSSHLL